MISKKLVTLSLLASATIITLQMPAQDDAPTRWGCNPSPCSIKPPCNIPCRSLEPQGLFWTTTANALIDLNTGILQIPIASTFNSGVTTIKTSLNEDTGIFTVNTSATYGILLTIQQDSALALTQNLYYRLLKNGSPIAPQNDRSQQSVGYSNINGNPYPVTAFFMVQLNSALGPNPDCFAIQVSPSRGFPYPQPLPFSCNPSSVNTSINSGVLFAKLMIWQLNNQNNQNPQ